MQCCNPDNYRNDLNEIGANTSNKFNKSSRTENKIETEIDFDRSKINHTNLYQQDPKSFNKLTQTFQNNRNTNVITSSNSIENDTRNDLLNRITSIRSVIEKVQKITLEVISSPSLAPGTIITINPFGIVPEPLNNIKSLRNKSDGVVFFGYIPPNSPTNKAESIIDIQLPHKDSELSTLSLGNTSTNQSVGKFFQIFFNPDHLKYYLLDCGFGYGTFVKIQSETILKDNSLINIGNSYISVSIGYEDDTIFSDGNIDPNKKIPSQPNKDYNNNLNLKIMTKNIMYDPINFQPTKSSIRIGRNQNCEVVVEDNMLSRVHCTVEYRNNVGWVIRDGVYNTNKDGNVEVKPSTNGTWLFASEEMPIYEGLIFKSNNNLFKCNYIMDN